MVEFKLTVLIVLCGLLVIVMPVTGEMYMLLSSNKFSCIIFIQLKMLVILTHQRVEVEIQTLLQHFLIAVLLPEYY